MGKAGPSGTSRPTRPPAWSGTWTGPTTGQVPAACPSLACCAPPRAAWLPGVQKQRSYLAGFCEPLWQSKARPPIRSACMQCFDRVGTLLRRSRTEKQRSRRCRRQLNSPVFDKKEITSFQRPFDSGWLEWKVALKLHSSGSNLYMLPLYFYLHILGA